MNGNEGFFERCLQRWLDCVAILSPVRDGSGRILDFRFEMMNEAGSRHCGFEPNHACGKTLLGLFPGSVENGVLSLYTAVAESGQATSLETQRSARADSAGFPFRSFDIRAFKVGEAIAVIWKDVSDQNGAEEKFRKIFESAPVGIATIGPNFRFRKANSAFLRMLRLEQDQLVGRELREFTHPDDFKAVNSSIYKLFNERIPQFMLEKRYVRGDGSTVWGRLTASVLRYQGGDGLTGLLMVEDIDERKSAEDAVAQQRKLLVRGAKTFTLPRLRSSGSVRRMSRRSTSGLVPCADGFRILCRWLRFWIPLSKRSGLNTNIMVFQTKL
jgi:PAS domain S-box-containing protein